MSALDRKLLLELTDMQKKKQSKKFAWGHQLYSSENAFTMHSFHVSEINEDILVPVTRQKLGVLKKVMENAVKTQGLEVVDRTAGNSLHINQTKIKTKSSDSFMEVVAPSLLSLALRNLLGFEVESDRSSPKIETNLVKLLLVEKDQQIQIHSKQEDNPGTFAIMVVTIPVEGGYRGGQINVEHRQQKKSFHFEKESSQRFSLVTFYTDCRHELERVTSGAMVAMVFHINWLDALEATTSPLEFPAFFKTFYEVSDILIPWTYSQSPDENAQVSLEEEFPSQLDEPEGSNRETLLLFPLDEKYGNAELSFSQLRGRDLWLARLFKSMSFLDVHLAIVSQLVDSSKEHFIDWESHPDWTDRTFQINQWIGWDNSLLLSEEIVLDARTQLVGNISRIQSVANGPDSAMNQVIYCHAVLVIQSRYHSIIHACRHQLDDVLSHMETQLSIIEKMDRRPVVRQQLISTLNQVISFCWNAPLLMWMDPRPATEDRSRRLLDLCINLNAASDGLELLDLLCTSHTLNTKKSETSGIPDMYMEGIRKEEVAKAVASLASRICGWETCSHLVLRLISPFLIFKQLAHFASLALHLMKENCFEGTLVVADRISSIVTKLDDRQTNHLNDYHLHAFVNMAIVLEENHLTANTSRMDTVEMLFKRLMFIRQCHFLTKLQSSEYHQQTACQQLMKKLCGCLVSSDFHSSNSPELVIPLMKSILKFGDVELVYKLVDKICLGPDSEEFLHSNVLLYSILASPGVLEVANLSRFGKGAVLNLLDAGIKQLHEKVSLPPTAEESDPSRWNLASCLLLALRLELNPEKRDSKLINASIGFMLCSLPTERLCDLILDLWKFAGDSLVNHPITYLSYVDVCRQLSLRDRKSVEKLGKEKIIQLAQCFVWLEDVESTRSLIYQLCIDESWNQEDKDVLTNIILSWQDVLDHLIPASSVFVSNTINIVIEAWVTKLIHDLESQEIIVSPANNQDYSVDVLDEEITHCIERFLHNEKKFPHAPDYGIELFRPLLNKLSDWRLALVLANIPEVEFEENSCLANCSTCFDFCCFVGQQFVMRDFFNKLFKPIGDTIVNTIVDVMIFFLWLGDDCSLAPFTRKISSSFSSWQENVFVSKIVASSQARRLAATCQASRNAFCLLLEKRISRLNMLKIRASPANQTPELEQGNLQNLSTEMEEVRILLHSLQDQSIASEENNSRSTRIENSIKRLSLAVDDFMPPVTPVKREKSENSPSVESS